MSNSAQTSASSRIAALLDENSFVEVGAYITARSTDFNMTEQETPAAVSYTHLDVYKRQLRFPPPPCRLTKYTVLSL